MIADILQELRKPSSPESLLDSLKSLKNEIVGHSQRKELWVRRGVVVILGDILNTHKTSSKRRSRNDGFNQQGDQHPLYTEDAKLQAIAIVGSLAHGGPAFMLPLRAEKIITHLLDTLSPTDYSPRLILAALRSLNAIADAVSLENSEDRAEEEDFLDVLYTDHALSNLNQILKEDPHDLKTQQQANLAIQLIAKTSNTERRRKQIKISRVFESLALRLASFVVMSHVQTNATVVHGSEITPAHPAANLSSLLHAICVVIADSKVRSSEFCCYAIWRSVFPDFRQDIYAARVPAAGTAAPSTRSMLDALTSQQPTEKPKNTCNLPPFNSLVTVSKLVNSNQAGASESGLCEGFTPRDNDDTLLVKWLLDVIRTNDGLTRLMAIWFVGVLFRSHMVSVNRRNSFSMLLIPMLVNMLDGEVGQSEKDEQTYSPLAKTTSQFIQETAPRVLAFFVQDNEFLQKSAVERNAIKKLSQLLKQAFNPISASLLTPTWNAHDAEEYTLNMDPSKACVLGRPGLEPIVHHTHQIRESYLIALSAIGSSMVENKQAIIDNGVLSYVIESLNSGSNVHSSGKPFDAFKPGNSVPTIIAACETVRALSRSARILRTSLADAGLVKPIHILLSHPNIEVQIAATAAVGNILLPLSSMRMDVTATGALHILCEHAHSPNPKLRLNALLALSNFVAEAPYESKIKVVQELRPDWLKHVMCTGAAEGRDSRGPYNGMGFSINATKSLNTSDTSPNIMHSSIHEYLQESRAEDINMIDFNGSSGRSEEYMNKAILGDKYGTSSDEYYDALTDERTAAFQAARDDLAAQEQGLTFVGNLLDGGPHHSEMVEYLFEEFGQDKLFDIFTDLLRPRSMSGPSGHDFRVGAMASKLVPPPTEIVIGVCHILANIAGGKPRYKQIVLAQKELLQLIKPLFTHPHLDVRSTLVWLVINITWREDAADRDGVVSRALEIKKLGIMDKVQEALNDTELDVRERAKQAIVSLDELIKS